MKMITLWYTGGRNPPVWWNIARIEPISAHAFVAIPFVSISFLEDGLGIKLRASFAWFSGFQISDVPETIYPKLRATAEFNFCPKSSSTAVGVGHGWGSDAT